MKGLSTFSVVNKLWSSLGKEAESNSYELDIEIHKKLLNFFQPGPFYYFVFNVKTVEFEFINPGFKELLGYDPSEANVEFWFNKIHPDDQPYFVNFENEIANFLYALPKEKIYNYKVQYDFRFQTKSGYYIRDLHQTVVLQQYEDGGIFKTLSLETDISHLKKGGKPILSFVGMNGEPSYYDVQIGEPLVPIKAPLTLREKQVLSLIIDGKVNKEIAEILNISKETVDRHRKNMHIKNNIKNTSELIAKAIGQGWL